MLTEPININEQLGSGNNFLERLNLHKQFFSMHVIHNQKLY